MTLEGERKLHRAAIGVYVLQAVRDAAFPLLIIVFISAFGGGLDAQGVLRGAIYGAIGVTIAAVSGWWRWDNTRWWVTAEGIHRKSGLINTKRTDVPFTRVQALDVQQGPVQRWFGVHSVHVQTGGGGATARSSCEAISHEDLDALRALVATPAPPDGDRAAGAEAQPRRPAAHGADGGPDRRAPAVARRAPRSCCRTSPAMTPSATPSA